MPTVCETPPWGWNVLAQIDSVPPGVWFLNVARWQSNWRVQPATVESTLLVPGGASKPGLTSRFAARAEIPPPSVMKLVAAKSVAHWRAREYGILDPPRKGQWGKDGSPRA